MNQTKKSAYPFRIGISLSGGAARGIAHLGVLQALEELNVYPDYLAGVSAGAIVGGMYANGHSPGTILHAIQKLNYFSFFRFSSFRKPGFFDLENLEKVLIQYIPHNSFEKLQIPLIISATDIVAGETAYFSEGEIIKPILASSCVPVLFSPVVYQNRTLVDGGIINSLEVEVLKENCDFIIGVHTNPFDKNFPLKSTRSLLERCLTLAIHSNGRANFKKCNLVIEPLALSKITAIHLNKATQIYEIGYQATMEMKDIVLETLHHFSSQKTQEI